MADRQVLYFINRFNWLMPERGELPGIRDWPVRHQIRGGRRSVQGALYLLERGPDCHGFDIAKAFQFLYIHEVEDSAASIKQALTGGSARGLFREVRGVYKRVAGNIGLPNLMYVSRQNWVVPERQGDWDDWYETVVMPSVLDRPGFLRGARHTIAHGPVYRGWNGPSQAYYYLNMYGLENDEAMKLCLQPNARVVATMKPFPGNRSPLEMMYEVRAVYRRIL